VTSRRAQSVILPPGPRALLWETKAQERTACAVSADDAGERPEEQMSPSAPVGEKDLYIDPQPTKREGSLTAPCILFCANLRAGEKKVRYSFSQRGGWKLGNILERCTSING